MDISHAFILGVIQGITEFLPISSSGHLVLGESFLGLAPETLESFDIAVHFGTLLAIFVYFRKDFSRLLGRTVQILTKKTSDEPTFTQDRNMIAGLIVGTLPIVILALIAENFLQEYFRKPSSVAVMFIVTAAAFVLAEYIYRNKIEERGQFEVMPSSPPKEVRIGWREGFIIGIAQAIALIPGVSRSGATISAGLAQGVDRSESARFSFLLGAIAIMAAIVWAFIKMAMGSLLLPELSVLAVGIVTSAIVGYGAVTFLLRFLKQHSLFLFAGYLLLAGLTNLALALMY